MSSKLRSLMTGPVLPLILLLALAFGSTAIASDDGDGERVRQVRIVACEGGEAAEINADELALGETRDIGVSCGKVVTVTRTLEDEIRVAVDGEVIGAPGEDGPGQRKVIVRTRDGADCAEGEDCEENVHVRKIVIKTDGDEDVDVQALIAEELLRDCEEGDEECRAEILRLVEEHGGVNADGEHVVVIKKKVRTGGDDHDHDHDH